MSPAPSVRQRSPARSSARGGDRRGDLGRVVRVVVDDEGAGRGGAEALEAPAGAGEVGERAGGNGEVGAGEPARGQRGGRVERVVRAWDRELDGDAVELE